MKISDLMIGDWVEYKGEYHRVNGIIEDQFCRLTSAIVSEPAEILDMGFVYLTDTWERVWVDSLKPVPLTEEVLTKNGFKKKDCDGEDLYALETERWVIVFFSENGCPYLSIEDVQDSDDSHNSVTLKDEVYNVHELQHALLLLGIDKELTL